MTERVFESSLLFPPPIFTLSAPLIFELIDTGFFFIDKRKNKLDHHENYNSGCFMFYSTAIHLKTEYLIVLAYFLCLLDDEHNNNNNNKNMQKRLNRYHG